MKGFAVLAAGALAAVSGVSGMKCPGSSSLVHASCEVTGSVAGNCTAFADEIKARVDGQYGAWHDPHNNGTYTIDSFSDSSIALHRTTGNGKYTDKMVFTLTSQGAACGFEACSESQVTSVSDFSTNYCNMRMLYCGSGDGCKPVAFDTGSAKETSVKPSIGAGHDKSACLKV